MAHAVSQILLLWGLILGAGQVLPRVGYAKELATWRCVAPVIVSSIFPEADPADEAATPTEETAPTVLDSSG